MKSKSIISHTVRKERKALGHTQQEFSQRVGVSLSFLRSLEQGKTTLRLDKVNEVLNFLGLELIPSRVNSNE